MGRGWRMPRWRWRMAGRVRRERRSARPLEPDGVRGAGLPPDEYTCGGNPRHESGLRRQHGAEVGRAADDVNECRIAFVIKLDDHAAAIQKDHRAASGSESTSRERVG